MRPFRLWCFTLLLAAPAFVQPPPAQVIEEPAAFCVDPAATYQTITGFGAGVFPLDLIAAADLRPGERERMYDLLYTGKGTRLNILRLSIPWDAEPLPEGDPLRSTGLRYNWPKEGYMRSLSRSLPPVLARVHPILLASPFTPPVGWKADKKNNWGGKFVTAHSRDYALYLADFLKYFRQEHKLDIDVLSVQNEPDVAAPWDSTRWTGEELRDFLKVLGATLREEGLSTKLMIPEGSTWDQTAIKTAPSLQDPQARTYIGILASHSYGWEDIVDRGRNLMQSTAARYGLPLWTSEMSILGQPDDSSMHAALVIARAMYRDFVEAGVSAWIYCLTMARADPNLPASLGLFAPPKDGALAIPKRFWAFANYSRFAQPGWKRMRIDGLGFANTGFVSASGDRFAIVALNSSLNPRPASYNFGAWKPSAVEAFRTAKDCDLAPVPGAWVDGNTLRATLAPVSVTTFVGRLERASHAPRGCVAPGESTEPGAEPRR
jgi:O-glycosyl hydrolase